MVQCTMRQSAHILWPLYDREGQAERERESESEGEGEEGETDLQIEREVLVR